LKNIKYLNLEDLQLVNLFISEEINDFEEFTKLGWSKTNLEGHLGKSNNLSIGYLEQNKICAILLGEKIINISNYDLEVHIMFVSRKNRRKRIGSKILKFLETDKDLTKISKVYLEVSEVNIPAIKFYEKNNFVFFKFRHNYYNNKSINAKCYLKKI